MKRFIKIAVLIIALVVPSLIYIFLRGFGENKFEIPVYYTDGISIEGCTNQDTAVQHLVEFESYPLEGIHLFYFPKWVDDDAFFRQCSRIQSKWPNVLFTAIADTTYLNNLGNVLLVSGDAHLLEIANCTLVLGQNHSIDSPLFNQLVLVDSEKRIRGYFTGNELKEMDRLDIELDILSREH